MARRPGRWRPTLLAVVLACLLVRPYAYRLWERFGPRPSPAQIEAELARIHPTSARVAVDGFHCEDGTRGWDYICRAVVQESYPGRPAKRRSIAYGVVRPPGSKQVFCPLPENQPVPSAEEYLRNAEESYQAMRRRWEEDYQRTLKERNEEAQREQAQRQREQERKAKR